MKIAFIPTSVSGVVFYRAWQPCEAIRKQRISQSIIYWFTPNQYVHHPWEIELSDAEKGPVIGAEIEMAVQWADAIVWMGFHTPYSLQHFKYLKAKYDKTFITEIDDYIFSIPEKNIASTVYRPGSDLVRIHIEQMRKSDGLIVSTPYLQELYKAYNSNIQVIENRIDLALWKKRAPSPGRRRVNLGWVGGGTHEEDLELIKEPLFRILEKNRGVRFTCLHGVPRFFRNHRQIKFDLDFKPVNRYPRWVAKYKFDIGLAPLVDNNFNRAKSNLRYLEYSAMGIPTIASPVDHFKRTIRHSDNGFLAETPQDWEEYMQFLIDNPEDRAEMGRRAYADVFKNFSVRHLGAQYRKAIQEIIDAKSYARDSSISYKDKDRGHSYNGVAAIH